MYLEDVILCSINQTADAQAREEIHRKAEELDNITYAMEETYVSSLESSLKISQINCVLMTMNHKRNHAGLFRTVKIFQTVKTKHFTALS